MAEPGSLLPLRRHLDPATVAEFDGTANLLVAQPGFRADPDTFVASWVETRYPDLSADQQRIAQLGVLEAAQAVYAASDDISSDEQLKLQQAMDQRSQLESSLSEILKTVADTQAAIAGNLKS